MPVSCFVLCELTVMTCARMNVAAVLAAFEAAVKVRQISHAAVISQSSVLCQVCCVKCVVSSVLCQVCFSAICLRDMAQSLLWPDV
jgi:hypothetical protein